MVVIIVCPLRRIVVLKLRDRLFTLVAADGAGEHLFAGRVIGRLLDHLAAVPCVRGLVVDGIAVLARAGVPMIVLIAAPLRRPGVRVCGRFFRTAVAGGKQYAAASMSTERTNDITKNFVFFIFSLLFYLLLLRIALCHDLS